MKIVALIPARGGSKGIPRKNIKIICKKPLISWSIDTAKKSGCFDKIYVSTDDQEIADIAIKYGAEIPFLRPKNISKDNTPGIYPALHLIDKIDNFDWLCLLQPTSPLRTIIDIRNLIEFSIIKNAKSVVSISKVKKHPHWMFQKDKNEKLSPLIKTTINANRQSLPDVFSVNGSIYLANKDWLKRNKTFINKDTLGYITSIENSIDIDEYDDFEYAEYILHKRIKQHDKKIDR